jgi:hypothetical protein
LLSLQVSPAGQNITAAEFCTWPEPSVIDGPGADHTIGHLALSIATRPGLVRIAGEASVNYQARNFCFFGNPASLPAND